MRNAAAAASIWRWLEFQHDTVWDDNEVTLAVRYHIAPAAAAEFLPTGKATTMFLMGGWQKIGLAFNMRHFWNGFPKWDCCCCGSSQLFGRVGGPVHVLKSLILSPFFSLSPSLWGLWKWSKVRININCCWTTWRTTLNVNWVAEEKIIMPTTIHSVWASRRLVLGQKIHARW